MLTQERSFPLSNGVNIPAVGLGTYKTRGADVIDRVVRKSIDSGYRLIDTAAVYRNEEEIGETLSKMKVERESVFITSKLSPSSMSEGKSGVQKAIEESLRKEMDTGGDGGGYPPLCDPTS